jgi:hypothetical protein
MIVLIAICIACSHVKTAAFCIALSFYVYLLLNLSHNDYFTKQHSWLIPEAARYKVWVCGRSLAGIAGSKPTGVMDVSLL